MIECIKNIECCDCPEMDSCSTYAQNKLFKIFLVNTAPIEKNTIHSIFIYLRNIQQKFTRWKV